MWRLWGRKYVHPGQMTLETGLIASWLGDVKLA